MPLRTREMATPILRLRQGWNSKTKEILTVPQLARGSPPFSQTPPLAGLPGRVDRMRRGQQLRRPRCQAVGRGNRVTASPRRSTGGQAEQAAKDLFDLGYRAACCRPHASRGHRVERRDGRPHENLEVPYLSPAPPCKDFQRGLRGYSLVKRGSSFRAQASTPGFRRAS